MPELLTALDAFLQEQDSSVDGGRVRIACDYRVSIAHSFKPAEPLDRPGEQR